MSLSINQASSIQSLGSTCESVTIGHNPFKLPLTARGIFLKRNRPLFLCEHLLGEGEGEDQQLDVSCNVPPTRRSTRRNNVTFLDETLRRTAYQLDSPNEPDETLPSALAPINRPPLMKHRSSTALLGKYKTLETLRRLEDDHFLDESGRFPVSALLNAAIHERKWSDSARRLFEKLDVDKDAMLGLDEFVDGLSQLNSSRSKEDLTKLFHEL